MKAALPALQPETREPYRRDGRRRAVPAPSHLRHAPSIGLATLLCAAGPASLPAQTPPDTFKLPPLVVTATRVALPRAMVPAAVTVLDGEELRARGIRFLSDALQLVPGAHPVQVGARGGLTSLFLRGGESDYVQVMVDGIVMNEPGGAFDFAHVTTDNIERIEIVRGPVSVLYGSDAVAGVVHIMTRDGPGPLRIGGSAGLSFGTRVNGDADACPGYPRVPCPDHVDLDGYASRNVAVTVSGSAAAVGYSLAASRLDGDGAYAFNSGYENRTLSGRVRVGNGSPSVLSMSFRWTDGLFRYPTDGAGRLVDRNQARSTESLALGLDLARTLAERAELRIALTLHRADAMTDDPPDGPRDTLGVFQSRSTSHSERRRADVHANIRLASDAIATLGFDAEAQTGKTGFASRSSFGPFESSSRNQRAQRAAYAQVIAPLGSALRLTAGGRADDNDRFGTFVTWRLGANLIAVPRLIVRAAASTGFKEPTFFENYAEGFVRGNPALEPEQSRSLELGIEREALDGRLRMGATWFDQRFHNLIQFVPQPATNDAPNYVNLGEARSAGLEVEAQWRTMGTLQFDAGWTLLDTEVLDAGTGQDRLFTRNEALIRRPTHRWTIGASAMLFDQGRATVSLTRVGSRDDLDFLDDFAGSRIRLPAYTTVDISGRVHPFRQGPAITVRIDNLLDARYRSVAHFPAAGRVVSLSLGY